MAKKRKSIKRKTRETGVKTPVIWRKQSVEYEKFILWAKNSAVKIPVPFRVERGSRRETDKRAKAVAIVIHSYLSDPWREEIQQAMLEAFTEEDVKALYDQLLEIVPDRVMDEEGQYFGYDFHSEVRRESTGKRFMTLTFDPFRMGRVSRVSNMDEVLEVLAS